MPFTNPFGSNGFGSNGFGSAGNGNPAVPNGATGIGGPANPGAIAAKVDPALVDVVSTFTYQQAQGAGTGIVLTSNGEVLTNNHVVDGATSIRVTDIGNGHTYTASVVGYAPYKDVALLKLNGASGLKTAKLATSKLAVGQPVVAVGNAGGVGGTPISAGGAITALNRSITAGDQLLGTNEQLSGLIEVNADVQSGDSGGSLVNTSGQVIGMDTAASNGFSIQSSGNQGYAIPIQAALAIVHDIQSGKGSSAVHVGPTAFVGVLIKTPVASGGFTGGQTAGADVSGVVTGGPAAKAGLSAGDIITSFNGHAVSSGPDLTKLLVQLHPGDKVSLGWLDSSGTPHTGTIVLGTGPAA